MSSYFHLFFCFVRYWRLEPAIISRCIRKVLNTWAPGYMTAPAPVAGLGMAGKGPGLRARIVGALMFVTAGRVAAASPALALVTVTVLLASSTFRAMLAAAGIVLRSRSRQPATPKPRSTPPCESFVCTSESHAKSTKKIGLLSEGASLSSLQVCVTLEVFWSETWQSCTI